jgi:hypothetical protein
MKIENIILKFSKLFPSHYNLELEDLCMIEKKLDILLPNDFKNIVCKCDFSQINIFSFFNINALCSDEFGLVNQNKIFREKINFPPNCVVLYYEYGLIYMETKDDESIPTPIIYCSDESACNLYLTGKPEVVYSSFPSFTDFFEYLLDEEEKLRAEIDNNSDATT